MHRADDRVWRDQRRVDTRACSHGALRFLGMVEQFLWKLHRPRNTRDTPIELAVDEIGAAPEEQTDRRSNDQIVAEVRPRDFVPVRVVKGEQQQAKHPAVAGHAALPDAQDRQRLAQHFWFIEENVAEASANDHAKERAAGDKVADSLWRKIGIPAFGQPKENEIAGDESQHISQTVPSRTNVVVNPKNDRIEAVQIVGEHSVWWRLSLMSVLPAIKTRVIPSREDGEGPHRG